MAGRELRLSVGTAVLIAVVGVLAVAVSVLATLQLTGSDSPAESSTEPGRDSKSPAPTATFTAAATFEPTATPTRTPVQPLNGTELIGRAGPGGPGYLVVKNGNTRDAIVRLVNVATGQAVLMVYVVRQSDWTIHDIGEGEYEVKFALGSDWDDVDLRFQRDADFLHFEETVTFEVTATDYSWWEITLNAVAGGNAPTEEIGEDDFFR